MRLRDPEPGRGPDQLYTAPALARLASRAPAWSSLSSREREGLGLVQLEGEFWLPWEDLLLQATDLSFTHLINTSLFSFSRTWRQSSKWAAHSTVPNTVAIYQGGGLDPAPAGGRLHQP